MNSGDSALAKGLADSVLRDVRATSDSMQEVQRALRQSKQIEARFPAAKKSEWETRLEQVAAMADAGEWQDASQVMNLLTSDLQSHEHKVSEATELVRFVNEEWKTLRRRLDSAGIGPTDPSRMAAEKTVSEASIALEQGDIESCHKALGAASEMLESQNRRV
jgi:hypothetical protein